MLARETTQARSFEPPALPEFLTALKGWVVWKLMQFPDEKKPRKVPHYVNGSMRKNHGTDEDRAQLATFAQACATARSGRYDGVGLAILHDFDVIALDFDNVAERGEVDPRVLTLVEGTYAEFSPSGRGVRAFFRGNLPSRKDNLPADDEFAVEFFGTSGFVTVTGNVLPDCELFGNEGTVAMLTQPVRDLYAERFGTAGMSVASVDGDDDASWLLTLTPKIGLTIDDARKLLTVITPVCGYQDWLGVGQALHHEFSGSDEARDLFDEWSQGNLLDASADRTGLDYAGPKKIALKWRSFGRFTGQPRSMAWVLKQAKEHRAEQRIDAVAAYRTLITEAGDEFTLREKVCTKIAEDERLDDLNREALAQALLDAFKGLTGTKYPIAQMRKLVAKKREPRHVTAASEGLPALEIGKDGRASATKENLQRAFASPELCGARLGYDLFLDALMVADGSETKWRRFDDNDYFGLALALETGGAQFQDITKDKARDAIRYVAREHKFDSARTWIEGLEWDRTPRVETFLTAYFGADDTPYHRAVAAYLWTALAGRVLQPGIKADMVPTAVGAQGTRKTSAIAAIAPEPDFFVDLDLGSKDEDIGRLLRGKLVIELGELKGLRNRERESLKAFITRTTEEWVPKFVEFSTRYPRRCVFFGSTNRDDFLSDDTGNRRWLPFRAGECSPDAIARDREQLWAEGRELFARHGILWEAAQRLAEKEHEQYEEHDGWAGEVEAWLSTPADVFDESSAKPGVDGVTAEDVLIRALHLDVKSITKAHVDRMGKLLKRLGMEQDPRRPRVNGRRVRTYRWPK